MTVEQIIALVLFVTCARTAIQTLIVESRRTARDLDSMRRRRTATKALRR